MGNLSIIDERVLLQKNFRIYGTLENPLFLAKDVAEWIEHSDTSMMLKTIDEDEKLIQTIFVSGQNRKIWFLTEDGLYEVLMQSRKPIAKQFKKEVKNILKTIRKTGSYSVQTALPDFTNPAEAARAWAAEYEAKQQALLEAKEAQDHVKMLVHNGKTYTSSEIAKELGMKSAIALNKLLEEKHVQYKQNGTWLLYSEHCEKGLTSVKQIQLDNGTIQYDRRWTGKGRDFILNLIR